MKPNRYTTVIDLTSRARKEQAQSDIASTLSEPDPPLPPATLDTLPESLRQAVRAAGWTELMPVQERAVPYILDRRDLIVQSRTGSGKTGAFLLPLFELLDPEAGGPQVLVLTPTRELALQVRNEFETLRQGSDATRKLRSVTVYGGVGYKKQIQAFKDGVHVVIGTPGRTLDHLQQGTLKLDGLRVLVLDEADEMLSMGFFPDMRKLKGYLPRERQSYMFSATMPYRVRQLGEAFLRDPGFLSLSVGQVHIDTMAHRYYVVEPMEKDAALRRLIELQNPDSAIVFANTKKKVEYLAEMLHNYGFDAQPITGDLQQRARERVMDKIRNGNLRLLIATDVAARGIDISDLSHVFMYDLPQDPEYYIHRAGRTARAGKTGMAITFATVLDKSSLLAIGRRYDIDLELHEAPTREDVQERVAERAVVLLEDALRERSADEKTRIRGYLDLAAALRDMGRLEILAMLVDAYYHAHLHARETGASTSDAAAPDVPTDAEAMVAGLQQKLDAKYNLQRRRLQRFLPLVEQLASDGDDGEPELIALLLHDYDAGRLTIDAGTPAEHAAKAHPSGRPGGSGGRGRRGDGQKGRGRSRRRGSGRKQY